MRAVFVTIAIPGVFIKIEVPVGPRIDTQFDGIRSLPCVLDHRPQRKNRTRAHVQRNPVDGRGCRNLPPACQSFTSPEVIPLRGSRQVNRAFRRVLPGHRAHQDVGTEEELIADFPCGSILAEVHHQRPLDGIVLARHLPRQRIDIGQEPVAQAIERQQRGINLVIRP